MNNAMHVTVMNNGNLQIDNCRIKRRNFSGTKTDFNRAGDRNFLLAIPDDELAESLKNLKNENGVGWNVNTWETKNGEQVHELLVKVKFSKYGPNIYLISGSKRIRVTEDMIDQLDKITIEHIDMDIRPYDGTVNGKPFRTAYLDAMEIVQRVDRFQERYMASMAPEIDE